MTVATVCVHYGEKITDEQLSKMNDAIIYGEKWTRINEEEGLMNSWNEPLVHFDLMPRNLRYSQIRIIDHPALESLELKRNPAFNHKVKVSVPGNGLLNINRVVVHQDMCTEKLQLELDMGWCILAVCPQPDQRRPDYILGMNDSPRR